MAMIKQVHPVEEFIFLACTMSEDTEGREYCSNLIVTTIEIKLQSLGKYT